jgi:SAM-dependent methyltransferase
MPREKMLFLSEHEKREWLALADEILTNFPDPGSCDEKIRPNLVPVFHFFIAGLLAAKGFYQSSIEWLENGELLEKDRLHTCAILKEFMERTDNRLVMPSVVFEDPRPFIHFASVPVMREARENFIAHSVHSLLSFDEPIRCIDIGCGDGALTISLLLHLQEAGKVPGVAEILLVEPSPAMASLAEQAARVTFPDATIQVENCRIQECSDRISHPFDIAIASFAYHHMPLEQKRFHLRRLKPWIDHLLLFEIDANNDAPELFSPDLALSVYQSYGRIIDFTSSDDAPGSMAIACVDSFLMTELVSLLTEPRGVRKDYHMLRSQWNALFEEVLSPEFSLRCDSTAYAEECIAMYTLHYGREQGISPPAHQSR